MNGFDAWRGLTPAQAAARFAARIAAHPPPHRRAALAWLPPTSDLEAVFARSQEHGGPWAGIPCAIKDLFDLAGTPTRASSALLANAPPATASGALAHFLEARGVAITAKTHLHEFAYGLTGKNRTYGDCPHPTLPGRLAGGSSSGSAWAVGSGLVPLAAGTDTGGSIRVPAAWCGIAGIRWAQNEWNRDGIIPLAPSCDAAGWFAPTPHDLLTWMSDLIPPEPSQASLRGLYLSPAPTTMAPRVNEALTHFVTRVGASFATSDHARILEAFANARTAYSVLTSREAWTYHRPTIEASPEKYDPDVLPLILRGRDWSEESIILAETNRDAIREAWTNIWPSTDFVIMPAVPCSAPTPLECTPELRNTLLDLNTPASLAALPALSLPIRLQNKTSIGAQIIAPSLHILRDFLRGLCENPDLEYCLLK